MNGFEQRAELMSRFFSKGVPFFFDFNGKALDVNEWECSRKENDGNVCALELKHDSGVKISCDVKTYADYPVLDWSFTLSYEGEGKSPMIENLHPVCLTVPIVRNPKNHFSHPILHHFVGSPCAGNDFEPRQSQVTDIPLHFNTFGGRSSNSTMPYFNVETTGQGVILAVGWAGQWEAEFSRVRGAGVQLWAGQENTHFCMMPGETLKAPRTVMLFY